MNKFFDFKIGFLFAVTFFIVGLLTLPHYGINWDTINHLPRGQAYLHYFLTGQRDYANLTPFKYYFQNPDQLLIDSNISKKDVPKRSLYQSDGTPLSHFLVHDGNGHPPLSDILASIFNLVLFNQLRMVNDIDSYRVYGILLSAFLVGLIYWWGTKIYGKFAGLFAALSLGTYPLFWSEAHFNIEKDIPETVFWSFTIFFFWKGVVEKKWKGILLSSVFFGLALGTKLNIVFSLFILIPWLGVYLISNRTNLLKKSKILLSILICPLIVLTIFIISWPYMWQDPIEGIENFLGFYKTIGLTSNVNPSFLGPLRTNTYPIQWIIFTTPPVILLLSAIGIISALFRLKGEKSKISLLILLWLLVPIIRVTMPGTTIYGGVRQIMEYIPALAVLSGLGGATLLNLLSKRVNKILAATLILLLFVPHVFRLISIHPNENVYFNFLIGGLKGAKSKNLPSWGNSFGAAYRQGVSWINKNVEPNSKVVLVNELLPNVPYIFFRPDLTFQNSYRSGYLRLGEYAMTLVYQGIEDRSYYDSYLEKFIEPVYQVKVDGVAILKVWKNDAQHLKAPFNEEIDSQVEIQKDDNGITFDIGEIRNLSRLEVEYSDKNCPQLESGIVQISEDGSKWKSLTGVLPNYWKVSILGPQPQGGKFIEPFVGEEARFIRLLLSPKDTCLKNISNFKVYIFK